MSVDERDGLPTVSRRRFLQASTFAGFGAFLAACTGSGNTPPVATVSVPTVPPVTTGPSAPPTPIPSPTGPLQFANWEAYIDLTGKAYDEGKYLPGSSPTVEAFKKKYKVDVNYVEKIN